MFLYNIVELYSRYICIDFDLQVNNNSFLSPSNTLYQMSWPYSSTTHMGANCAKITNVSILSYFNLLLIFLIRSLDMSEMQKI